MLALLALPVVLAELGVAPRFYRVVGTVLATDLGAGVAGCPVGLN
jgi:hypothetical protein